MFRNALALLPLLRFLPDLPAELILRLPPSLVLALGQTVSQNLTDEKLQPALRERRESLEEHFPSWTMNHSSSKSAPPSRTPARGPSGPELPPFENSGMQGPVSRRDLYFQTLKLYFFQLFRPGPVFVDLSHRALQATPWGMNWKPAPLFFRAPEHFSAAMLDIYGGLYEEREDQFQSGLDALNLGPMKDIFRSHFMGGDVEALQFKPAVLKESFHRMLNGLRDLKEPPTVELAFLALSLFCLYEGLHDAPPLNAKTAYREARPGVHFC